MTEEWSRPGPVASVSLNEVQLSYVLITLYTLGVPADPEKLDTVIRLERAFDKLHDYGA